MLCSLGRCAHYSVDNEHERESELGFCMHWPRWRSKQHLFPGQNEQCLNKVDAIVDLFILFYYILFIFFLGGGGVFFL